MGLPEDRADAVTFDMPSDFEPLMVENEQTLTIHDEQISGQISGAALRRRLITSEVLASDQHEQPQSSLSQRVTAAIKARFFPSSQ